MRLRNSTKMSQGTNNVKKRLNFKTPKAGGNAHKMQKQRGWLISALSLARASWARCSVLVSLELGWLSHWVRSRWRPQATSMSMCRQSLPGFAPAVCRQRQLHSTLPIPLQWTRARGGCEDRLLLWASLRVGSSTPSAVGLSAMVLLYMWCKIHTNSARHQGRMSRDASLWLRALRASVADTSIFSACHWEVFRTPQCSWCASQLGRILHREQSGSGRRCAWFVVRVRCASPSSVAQIDLYCAGAVPASPRPAHGCAYSCLQW